MALHRIRKGLNLPITGEPAQAIEDARPVKRVALVAADYHGMKPKMFVKVGDTVSLGQPLFEDRKTPGILYTAPASGTVAAIHRGERRALQSVVVEVGSGGTQTFKAHLRKDVSDYTRDEVRNLLLESGMWPALRTRPFSRVPDPQGPPPHAIFVTAMDTHPLAPDVDTVLAGKESDFYRGLAALTKLTDGKTYLCRAKGSKVSAGTSGALVEDFQGRHPAGTVGVHIHFVSPASRARVIWHVGYQEVVSIGRLFESGTLDTERVVALAGPPVKKPRLLRTRLGASIDELVEGELADGEMRVISGSVLSGRAAMGPERGYLGRYDNQISVLAEYRERDLLGWMTPGLNTFSAIPTFLGALIPGRKFAFTTTTNGSSRAMVPIGVYERVMPMDILPTQLLRALMVEDVEWAEELGALELDEEDLSLCTFVCPGKVDYGPALRRVLDKIWKEG